MNFLKTSIFIYASENVLAITNEKYIFYSDDIKHCYLIIFMAYNSVEHEKHNANDLIRRNYGFGPNFCFKNNELMWTNHEILHLGIPTLHVALRHKFFNQSEQVRFLEIDHNVSAVQYCDVHKW